MVFVFTVIEGQIPFVPTYIFNIQELLGIILMSFLHMRTMWNSLKFCNRKSPWYILVYNEEDAEVKRRKQHENQPVELAYYSKYKVENGTTLLETRKGDTY
jgi:hypothetical protein